MRGLLILLVLVAAVVLALPYFVLPPVLENYVAREVQDRLGLAERPAVELDSDPQWRMLLGEFSDGRVSVGATDLSGVRARNVAMDLDPFSLDVGESLQSRAAVVGEPVSGRMQAEISEAEVMRLAQANAQVPVNGVDLARSGVTVESEASALGTTFPVDVRGGVATDGDAIVFQPENVQAAGVPVPPSLADSLLAGSALRFPVEGLPYGGTLTGARVVDGGVVVTGRVSGAELGASAGG